MAGRRRCGCLHGSPPAGWASLVCAACLTGSLQFRAAQPQAGLKGLVDIGKGLKHSRLTSSL